MRLLDLHLKAFGPFTDRRLDLSGGESGLHLVYGPNEAGKSSALRALKALLYGFPARSGDDHLHPYDQLRVGARLRFADGVEQEILRRKGKKATLLAPDGQTLLDGSLLDRSLQGVDEALFSSLFGLDHDALVHGGEELLAERGDVGQALFAAGLGTRNLRQVLAGLDAEAEALFLPRGSKPRINQGIAEHREAKRATADLSLSGREWDSRRREQEAKRAESAGLERDLEVRKTERNRLQRIRRVQPLLAERRDLACRAEELGEVALLAADFGDRRRATREAIRGAAAAAARAASELAELRREAAALAVAPAVLDQAESVERLHRGVDLYTKGIADRSRLLGEESELAAAAAQLLDELRPGLTVEEAGALRPSGDRQLRIQELGQERQARWNAAAQAAAEAAEAERALGAARAAALALPPARQAAALARRIAAARKAGDLDGAVAEAESALARGDDELRRDIGRLGLWRGAAEALEELPVPGEESLRRFAEAFDALEARRGALAERRRAAGAERDEAARRLDEIRRGGAVPTEGEMVAARERRDHLWSLLRNLLRGAWPASGGAAAPAAKTAAADLPADPAAYEDSVAAADELADRLRREADRVQEQAQLLARRDALERTADDLERRERAAAAEDLALRVEWRALWQPCGIEPLPPREMHPAWTRRHEALRARAETLGAERRRLEELAATRTALREALRRELAALADPQAASTDLETDAAAGSPQELLEPLLEPLAVRGEERLRALERREVERARLAAAEREAEGRLAAARQAAAGADADLEAWREAWGEAIRDLGLDRDARPAEAMQVVEALRSAFASLHDAAKVGRRIAGIDRDLETFRDSVEALARELAPDLAGRAAEQAAVQLQALSTDARREADRRAALARRIAKLEDEARSAGVTRRAMEEALAGLTAEAGCADAAGLEEAERRSSRLRELERDLERVERQLREEGEGLARPELESEAGAVAADALPGRIDQLDREIAELERRSLDLREELGRGRQELDQMAGGAGAGAAAAAAERSEEVLAGLREDVHRYARLRLAAGVLRREIERYRAENQDPLLRRAAELFATLTLERYAGLATAFDERDEPVLAGVRPDGRSVRVEGMSDGTRDQLYLALRLATLERYLAHAEPLPFVVDDILINFDDARSAATLGVLADLAAKTQVILFTHHAHLCDLAAGLAVARNGGAGVFVRALE